MSIKWSIPLCSSAVTSLDIFFFKFSSLPAPLKNVFSFERIKKFITACRRKLESGSWGHGPACRLRGSEPHPALASPPLGVRLGAAGPAAGLGDAGPAPVLALCGAPRLRPQANGCRCPAFRGLDTRRRPLGGAVSSWKRLLQQVGRVLTERPGTGLYRRPRGQCRACAACVLEALQSSAPRAAPGAASLEERSAGRARGPGGQGRRLPASRASRSSEGGGGAAVLGRGGTGL